MRAPTRQTNVPVRLQEVPWHGDAHWDRDKMEEKEDLQDGRWKLLPVSLARAAEGDQRGLECASMDCTVCVGMPSASWDSSRCVRKQGRGAPFRLSIEHSLGLTESLLTVTGKC